MLLLAYLGEISSERTRVPTVILLLVLGWFARNVSGWLNISIPVLDPVLPVLGTFGLILIVLDGALELKVDSTKIPIARKAFLMALLPMIFLSLFFTAVFAWYTGLPFYRGLVNALPFAVVSSSIAISSTRNISPADREFVVYESSLSDILGVLFFNFFITNEIVNVTSVGLFLLQIVLIILISVFSVIGLAFLLGRIKNHITYTPIIVLVGLVYFLAKTFDLSGLVFILILGLFLGNINEVKKLYIVDKVIGKVDWVQLENEIAKFKAITIEATFLVRSLFFILFGFMMKNEEFLDLTTLPWAIIIVAVIYSSRYFFLRFMKLSISPLLYFSPRGLITILLFMSVTSNLSIYFINNSLLVQVIILSVIVMMSGLIREKKA
ncbi:MAG TPA: cation:proton antiporter [Bacteroidales bacterium]|nr:cation:proton antiporter [Bacteroidales bacterium]